MSFCFVQHSSSFTVYGSSFRHLRFGWSVWIILTKLFPRHVDSGKCHVLCILALHQPFLQSSYLSVSSVLFRPKFSSKKVLGSGNCILSHLHLRYFCSDAGFFDIHFESTLALATKVKYANGQIISARHSASAFEKIFQSL